MHCWNKDGHGDVNLLEALMESCDVYFYNVGQAAVRAERPRAAGRGAGSSASIEKTGVDLPGESKGQVPDKDWKKQAVAAYPSAVDRIWKTGDEVNLAIGQGDMLATPLQLATAFAAIANADAGKADGEDDVQLNVLVPHVGHADHRRGRQHRARVRDADAQDGLDDGPRSGPDPHGAAST